MTSLSMEAQARQLGIPMQMVVDDGLRYSDCDAHMATLISIEGTKALYQGQCGVGHKYAMDYEIEELQRMTSIVNGELVYGDNKGFVAGDLGEF